MADEGGDLDLPVEEGAQSEGLTGPSQWALPHTTTRLAA